MYDRDEDFSIFGYLINTIFWASVFLAAIVALSAT